MPLKQFYLQLGLLTIATAVLIAGMALNGNLKPFLNLGWISLGLFVALSAAIFHIGSNAAKNPDKHLFTTVILGFTFFKMMLAIGVIFGYMKLAAPASKIFVLPFLGVYLFYTIFEVYFLSKLGRMSVGNKP